MSLVLQAAASDGGGKQTTAASSWGPDKATGTRWQTEGSQASEGTKRAVKEAAVPEHIQSVGLPSPSNNKASCTAVRNLPSIIAQLLMATG